MSHLAISIEGHLGTQLGCSSATSSTTSTRRRPCCTSPSKRSSNSPRKSLLSLALPAMKSTDGPTQDGETALPPELEQILAKLPDQPGVYLMKDKRGKIVYIGKAARLRDRV